MKRIIVIMIGILATLLALGASARGWGISSQLKDPVSIRGDSTHGRRTYVGFFAARSRTHRGGGLRGGK